MSAYDELCSVNFEINHSSKYMSDLSQYGAAEYWADIRITKEGDCEDYGIAKAKELLRKGWDVQALRIAKCYVEEFLITDKVTGKLRDATRAERYHGVLLVDLEGVTYCLDNRCDEVRPYQLTGYEFDWVQIPGTLLFAKPTEDK